jgi:hypothetical protein
VMFAACIAKAIALYRGSILATGDMVQDHLRSTLTPADDNAIRLIGRACMTMPVAHGRSRMVRSSCGAGLKTKPQCHRGWYG